MYISHNVKERFRAKCTEQPRCVIIQMILHLKFTKKNIDDLDCLENKSSNELHILDYKKYLYISLVVETRLKQCLCWLYYIRKCSKAK